MHVHVHVHVFPLCIVTSSTQDSRSCGGSRGVGFFGIKRTSLNNRKMGVVKSRRVVREIDEKNSPVLDSPLNSIE